LGIILCALLIGVGAGEIIVRQKEKKNLKKRRERAGFRPRAPTFSSHAEIEV